MLTSAPYWEWEGFEGVYLEDSYVLEITELPSKVIFSMLLVLSEHHPDYSPPEAGERYSYRHGEIEFSDVTSIVWKSRKIMRYKDKSGETDIGNIDTLCRTDGLFEVVGDWGDVRIEAGMVTLRVQTE